MIQLCGLVVLLVPCVITDLRNRTVPLIYILTFVLVAILLNLVLSLKSITEMILGALPGFLFFTVSILTKGSIGKGDCFLFAAAGIWCGFQMMVTILLVSFLVAGITGLIIALFTKKGLKMTLPFVPFLGAGWMVELLLEIVMEGAVPQ